MTTPADQVLEREPGQGSAAQTPATDSPPPVRDVVPRVRQLLVPGLMTGVLLWLCYFPAACGWLAWAALVPLLCLVRSPVRGRTVYFCAWAAGLAFYWPALQWLREADYRMYYTWAALATYCSFYPVVAVFLLRRLDRQTRVPLGLSVPVVWTALDYLRGTFGGGFAWYLLGQTQHDFLLVAQVADLGGVCAVTFVVAAVNGWLCEILHARRWFRRLAALPEADAGAIGLRSLGLQTAAVGLLVGGCLAYGGWRLSQERFAAGPTVALLQGNVDQRLRNAAMNDPALAATSLDHYLQLTQIALEQPERPDLIVWPETSFPKGWLELSPQLTIPHLFEVSPDAHSVQALPWFGLFLLRTDLLRTLNDEVPFVRHACRTSVLFGVNTYIMEPGDRTTRYNSALLLDADGWVRGRYDKIHRVLFGEYIPFEQGLPFLARFAPYDFEYSIQAGERLTRFPLVSRRTGRSFTFGTVICYEDSDLWLARQYGRTDLAEPPVDFLVNISNDGWFNGSSEHEEHLAVCRFRAIESRRAVVRAVNMGISAVIDGSGRVVRTPRDSWARSKKVADVLIDSVPIDNRTSFYAHWGDWLPWSCWIVIGILVGRSLFTHQRRPIAKTPAATPPARGPAPVVS